MHSVGECNRTTRPPARPQLILRELVRPVATAKDRLPQIVDAVVTVDC
jgi:hypothetical protein